MHGPTLTHQIKAQRCVRLECCGTYCHIRACGLAPPCRASRLRARASRGARAAQKWGWVLEMYGFTIACYNAGIAPATLHIKMMSQPPWDTKLWPYYLLHFTYGTPCPPAPPADGGADRRMPADDADLPALPLR